MLAQIPLSGPLPNLVNAFSQMLAGERVFQTRLDMQEREQELREKELKLRQDALEQEQIERQAQLRTLLESQAGQQAAAAQPAAVQQIADAGQQAAVPVQQIGQQAARRQIESPQASPVQRAQAGQQLGLTPEQARAAGREATFEDRLAELQGEVPEEVQDLVVPFARVARQVGTDVATMMFESSFPTTELEEAQLTGRRLQNQLIQKRIQEVDRTLEQAETSRDGLVALLSEEFDPEQAEAIVAGLDDTGIRQLTNAMVQRRFEQPFQLARPFLTATDELGRPLISNIGQLETLLSTLKGQPLNEQERFAGSLQLVAKSAAEEFQEADEEEQGQIVDEAVAALQQQFPFLEATRIRSVVSPMIRADSLEPPEGAMNQLEEEAGDSFFFIRDPETGERRSRSIFEILGELLDIGPGPQPGVTQPLSPGAAQ